MCLTFNYNYSLFTLPGVKMLACKGIFATPSICTVFARTQKSNCSKNFQFLLCKLFIKTKKNLDFQVLFVCFGDVLVSRAVSSQVSSALGSLTCVFGMGTSGPSLLLSPNFLNNTNQLSLLT